MDLESESKKEKYTISNIGLDLENLMYSPFNYVSQSGVGYGTLRMKNR